MNGSILCAALACAVSLLAASPAAAQEFPSRPIKIVVPITPGGTLDLVSRLVGKHLGEKLGTPVIVDNKPGGNGVIGVNEALRGAADGYTLLSTPVGGLSPAFIKNPPFDILRDFEPVSSTVQGGYMLFAAGSFPVNNVAEFVAYAKANPGKVSVGIPSALSRLAFELFKKAAGIDVVSVPYKGSAPILAALTSGEIQASFDAPGSYSAFVQVGRARGLMFSTEPRLAVFPMVPTPRESGFPDYKVGYTTALLVPAGTPAPVIARLNKAIGEVLQLPEVQKSLRAASLEPTVMSPSQVKQVLAAEFNLYLQAARAAGVTPE